MMERIKYRFSLDTHKAGIQKTLQGFYSTEVGRSLEINLVANGDTIEIPEGVVASLYLNDGEDILPCTIDGNTICCDLGYLNPGITEVQLKILAGFTRAEVLVMSPKFALETWENGDFDDEAMETDKFTALDNALVRANAVYNSRITRFVIDDDLTIRVEYADGSVYESTKLHDLYALGENAVAHYFAEISKSWAVGGTGQRSGEDTNNSEYYSRVSNSHAEEAHQYTESGKEVLQECREHSAYTKFDIDFETGNLTYMSQNYKFEIDEDTGNLIITTDGEWTPDEITKAALETFIAQYASSVSALSAQVTAMQTTINGKASTSDLTALQNSLQTSINAKADASTVNSLNSTVSSLNTTVGTKANQSDVTTLSGKVTTLEGSSGVKNGSISYVSAITGDTSIVTSNLHIKKDGSICVINGYIFFPAQSGDRFIPVGSKANKTIGTLASGYRPLEAVVIGEYWKTLSDNIPSNPSTSGQATDWRNGAYGTVQIQSDGSVTLLDIGVGEDNSRVYINAVFMVG